MIFFLRITITILTISQTWQNRYFYASSFTDEDLKPKFMQLVSGRADLDTASLTP